MGADDEVDLGTHVCAVCDEAWRGFDGETRETSTQTDGQADARHDKGTAVHADQQAQPRGRGPAEPQLASEQAGGHWERHSVMTWAHRALIHPLFLHTPPACLSVSTSAQPVRAPPRPSSAPSSSTPCRSLSCSHILMRSPRPPGLVASWPGCPYAAAAAWRPVTHSLPPGAARRHRWRHCDITHRRQAPPRQPRR